MPDGDCPDKGIPRPGLDLHCPKSYPLAVQALIVCLCLAAPQNEDFSRGLGPWTVPKACAEAGYTAKTVEEGGRTCALLARDGERKAAGFGNLMRTIDAAPLRGKGVAVRASVKVDGGSARLWVRVDRVGGRRGFFANMGDRPIAAAEWTACEIVGPVSGDATEICFGLILEGDGRAWLDDVAIEAVPAPVPSDRALDNLVAFTRLFGYVRYFHPSDQAEGFDWDAFAVDGVKAVEGAKDAAELATSLQKLFTPLGPTIRVFETGKAPPAAVVEKSDTMIAWKHHGLGLNPASPYFSKREKKPASDVKPYEADLGGGVSCVVPTSLYVGGSAVEKPAAPASKPGSDRATRLASVAIAWNILQHFYPYFDVAGTDWPAELRRALASAALDCDDRDFIDTLRRLIAALKDGHGNVWHRSRYGTHELPVAWDWVEDRLVVTHSTTDGLKRGDVVEKIDGRPAAEALADVERLVSGATPQWIRAVGLGELKGGAKDSEVALEIAGKTVRVKRTAPRGSVGEPRPKKIEMLRDGVWYVDIDRVTAADFEDALDDLEDAKGVVFDLRGYPNKIFTQVIEHLVDDEVTCAQWHIPEVARPDRTDMTFAFSNWTVKPKGPRLKAKIAFVTGGGAVSAAETFMGIVENYKLGEIVGGPTAGTNGNVNPFQLPGGFTIAWTGMKVLKHDGSRHHGVGIAPTVPVSRTVKGVAEGRDEILERAVKVVE